jgi:PadR family transcriptional regulator AphA
MAVPPATREQLLLGEWACLGIVAAKPTHGFAVAARLKPSGDVGRVWSLTRPLTYRCLDLLLARGYLRTVGREPGNAGPNRTIVAATRTGRAQLGEWLQTPVTHLRDLRSELLLKLVLADLCDVDLGDMLHRQREHTRALADTLSRRAADDVVALWRAEASQAAVRFLDRLPRRPGSATAGCS